VTCRGSYAAGVPLEVGVNVTATVQGCSALHGNLTRKCSARLTTSILVMHNLSVELALRQSAAGVCCTTTGSESICLHDTLASAHMFVRDFDCWSLVGVLLESCWSLAHFLGAMLTSDVLCCVLLCVAAAQAP
jgi:hypothetical protein